jgi:surface antigen
MDTPLFTPRADLRGTTLVGLHHGSQWRAKSSETKTLSIADCGLPIAWRGAFSKVRFAFQYKSLHAKSIGSMRVD